jgi:hypothetical protein
MGSTKYGIITNSNGEKTEFVLVRTAPDGTRFPEGYALQAGESLILEDVDLAQQMFKPRWTGAEWEETATPEEIAAGRMAFLFP